MAASHAWAFRASFRRNAFGWSGTRKAIERLNEAVGEIKRMARADPALAGEGAVLLLEKLSPAVNQIDSSSGALGNATNGVVEKMVPLIAAAPMPRRVREKWLERLLDAIQEDDPPYIESLGEHWGVLCADPALASHWADQLLPLMQLVMADRRKGTYAYAKTETLCYSALFHAGRFDDLLAVLALDPKPYWHDQQWAAKALAARGDVDGAVNLMEGCAAATRRTSRCRSWRSSCCWTPVVSTRPMRGTASKPRRRTPTSPPFAPSPNDTPASSRVESSAT